MFSDRGIPMDWTTIAKVEKNDRSVRIDEAAGISDLFGICRLEQEKRQLEQELAKTRFVVDVQAKLHAMRVIAVK